MVVINETNESGFFTAVSAEKLKILSYLKISLAFLSASVRGMQ